MPHHMRRSDRAITDSHAISRIFSEGRYATIGLSGADGPYVVTLSYGHDAESSRLYFHVAHEGHKLDLIAEDPRACATIIAENGYNHGECEHPFESLVLFGRMRVVDDPEEKLRAINCLVDHLERDPEGYWGSRPWRLEDRVAGFTALAFEIEEVTAKAGR